MKTRSLWLLGLLALALVFAGCSSGGGEDYSIALADPSALPSYTMSGNPEPADNTEAKASAAAVDSAMSTELNALQTALSSAINAAATQTENYNETFSVGGGTVTITGSGTYTYPDGGDTGTYSARMNYTADVNGVTLDTDGNTSRDTTVNGQSAANYLISMTVTQSGSGYRIDVSVQGQFGWALSVSSSEPNVSRGKYVLLINIGGSGSVTTDANGNITSTSDFSNAISVSGTLRVYNNSNTLIRETTLSDSDLSSDEALFSFY